MSAFNTASLLLFPGLALVALAIGLLVRRYSASALAVGLTGLLTLALASTWITTAGPIKVPTERQPPNGDVERMDGELLAEQNKRAVAQRNAADADRKAAAATAKSAELDEKVREAQKGQGEAERRVALLEDKLRGVLPAPPAPALPDLTEVRRKLVDGDRPYYSSQEERELIPGRRGAWYVVRLLRGGRDWTFDDRQFVVADTTEIKVSAARLRDDVLLPLSQGGRRWRLYVRGSADVRRIAGPVGRELSYLPRLSDGTHSPEPRGKRVTVPVQNEDLPTLRADWLREIIRPVLSVAATSEIEVLENPPQPGHGRTAELVLFVEW